jgi:hypothetical protein
MTRVRLNAARLRQEMARGGLHAVDLARLAKISDATVSHALRGRRLRAPTVRKMAVALAWVPVIDCIDELVEPEP